MLAMEQSPKKNYNSMLAMEQSPRCLYDILETGRMMSIPSHEQDRAIQEINIYCRISVLVWHARTNSRWQPCRITSETRMGNSHHQKERFHSWNRLCTEDVYP